MGEPAGIGGELALKAWLQRDTLATPFFVIDDPRRLRALGARFALDVPIVAIDTALQAVKVFRDALPVLPLSEPVDDTLGTIQGVRARAVLESIDTAVRQAKAGQAAAVVTNPIHKAALYAAGFDYPGHTEYLGVLDGGQAEPVMMLASRELRVVPVTVHVALEHAVRALQSAAIERLARVAAMALQRDFGIDRPRLAVLGLNPHAGESGAMGREEIDIIAPAIDRLRAAGLHILGPLAPDTAFTAEARRTYDVAICMYHDQGLIPLKTLDIHGGVNVTLGLSFVRTSPDHGTALDIATRGIANPGSLLSAIAMAADMATRRRTACAANEKDSAS